ncbi:MAG: M6 family metalloprotease domain-containing protein, partial [Spirochaetaceae bacterium]|nr:M6 family metalloprotease domain-containing protein [Spirochaetaceae bacterium]
MKKNHYLAILLFLLSTVIYAMPPHPDVIQEYKKNGTLPLLSSRMAADSRAGMNVSSKSFPLFGSRKVLVLLAGFTDQPFDGGSTPAFYSQLFTGIDDNALSWKKYYKDMSNGQLILEFDIYNVGTVGEDLAYYGANSTSDDMDIRPREFVSEVVALGDSFVNYRNYDNDGDGYVDTVIIIHSGAGEEIGPLVGDTSQSDIDNRIWSHQWGITPTLYNDVYVSSYAIQPEFVETAGDSSIGVFVHEFGHVLGLPDLYDTSYESDGIGDWGLMAGGAWAGPSGNGSQPVPLSAWSRMQLGWISVEDLN